MPRDSFATCYLSLINSRKKTNILRSTGTKMGLKMPLDYQISTIKEFYGGSLLMIQNVHSPLFFLNDRRERALQAAILTESNLRCLINLSNRFQCKLTSTVQ